MKKKEPDILDELVEEADKPRKRSIGRKWTMKQVIDGIHRAGGAIGQTCEYLQMSPTEFYRTWRGKKEIEEAIKQERRIGAALVHQTVYEKAIAGDPKFASLYLRYNPESREDGYDGNWRAEETIKIKSDKPLSDEEKTQLKESLFGSIETSGEGPSKG